MIQMMLAIWSLVPLPFLKPAWTSGSSQFMYCWSLAWRILSIILIMCEMSAVVQWFEHSLALPFFGIVMKTNLFQSCGHCWVFQICWHIEFYRRYPTSMEHWTSSNLGKEYNKDVYCYFAYLTHMQGTSCKMPVGWLTSWNHDFQEKFQQPQISRWYHSNGRKQRGTKEPLNEGKKQSGKASLKLNIQNTKIWHLLPSFHDK